MRTLRSITRASPPVWLAAAPTRPAHAPTHAAKELRVHEMAHAVMNFGLDDAAAGTLFGLRGAVSHVYGTVLGPIVDGLYDYSVVSNASPASQLYILTRD